MCQQRRGPPPKRVALVEGIGHAADNKRAISLSYVYWARRVHFTHGTRFEGMSDLHMLCCVKLLVPNVAQSITVGERFA